MNVGFIGLGRMGAGMAANLVKAGHQVTVYNRTPAKAQALVGRGAKLATKIADACGGEAVFTMLADDPAVEHVVFGERGVLASLAASATHIASSTISVTLSERLAEAHRGRQQKYVAAPVFGRPEAAESGQLLVVAAGEPAAIEAVKPLLDSIGPRTFIASATPQIAHLVKLSGNFLIAAAIECLGEALALITKAGVDPRQYVEMLTTTLFPSPVYRNYGGVIASRKFEPAGFAATLGNKDIRITLEAAEQLRVPMPVASLLRDRFLRVLAEGGDRLDWSAIGGLAAKDAAVRP